eukprot:6201026-Pleurochrysis_carterae.AAC.1
MHTSIRVPLMRAAHVPAAVHVKDVEHARQRDLGYGYVQSEPQQPKDALEDSTSCVVQNGKVTGRPYVEHDCCHRKQHRSTTKIALDPEALGMKHTCEGDRARLVKIPFKQD